MDLDASGTRRDSRERGGQCGGRRASIDGKCDRIQIADVRRDRTIWLYNLVEGRKERREEGPESSEVDDDRRPSTAGKHERGQ